MSSLLCIAHRGGPIINGISSPENSVQAIRNSMELGVDAIEIDIWNLHGELFVTHDRLLGRQLPGNGLLQSQSLESLNALRLSNGEPIPRLTNLLSIIGNRAALNIEIKGPDCAGLLTKTLLAFASDHGISLEQYSVSSFDQQQFGEGTMAQNAHKKLDE